MDKIIVYLPTGKEIELEACYASIITTKTGWFKQYSVLVIENYEQKIIGQFKEWSGYKYVPKKRY